MAEQPESPSFLKNYIQSLNILDTPHDSSPLWLDDLILEQSLAGIYLLRADEFLYVNETLADMFGYSVSEIVRSQSPQDLVTPHDRDRVRANIQARLSGEREQIHYQFDGRAQSGRSFRVEAQGSSIQYEGQPAVVGTLIDVSGRKRAREELRCFRTMVNEASDALLAVEPDTGFILKANKTADEMMNMTRSELLQTHLQSLFVDLPREDTWSEFLTDLRNRSTLLMQSRFEPNGTNQFTAELNLRYVQDSQDYLIVVVRDISKRLKEETMPTLSERLFRKLTQYIDLDFWMVDPGYEEFVYTNSSFHDTWGDYFENQEDVQDSFLKAVHPEDRPRIRQYLETDSDKGYDEEYRMIRPTDEQIRWVREKTFALSDSEGRVIRKAHLAEDITSRKQTLAQLEESKQRFHALAKNLNETLWLYELDPLNLVFVNDEYENMFGRSAEELQSEPLSFLKAVHEDDRSWLQSEIDRQLSLPKPQAVDWEYRILDEHGEVRWLWTIGVPIKNERGEVERVAGFTTDISERKQIMDALQMSEHRFRQMAENIGQVFALFNQDRSKVLYVNPAFEEIWGFPTDELLDDPDRWLDALHAEDRSRVQDLLDKRLSGDLREDFSIEYRIVRPDGELRWIREEVSPVKTNGFRNNRVVVVANDVTTERRVQNELKKSIDEKETLLKEVHHRVKNNLQVVMSLLGLQERRLENLAAQDVLKRSQERIYAMALIHRKLYDNDRLSDVDFADYVRGLTEHLIDSHNYENSDLTPKFDLESLNLDLDDMVPLGLTLAELVSNALQHGLIGKEGGVLTIETYTDSQNSFHLIVQDNGPGWKEEAASKNNDSLGLNLVKNLVKNQLKGSVRFYEENGIEAHVSVPLPERY